jgi:uncharacterized protein involved in exopolysaccharide biosynthesis
MIDISLTMLLCQAEMEKKMVEPVQEGEEQKSATAVVAEVLTKECPSSTFLMNVGLQSSSARNKLIRSQVVAAQVTDLQEKLEKSEQQGVAMREELAALRKKSEEAEAAQAARDKEYELRFARLIAMFGGPSSGN